MPDDVVPILRRRPRPAGAALWTTQLDRAAPVALSRQLAVAMRRSIADGGLTPGARLPSSRALAKELGLARSTVVGVFEQLTAEGFIAARPGSGCYVPERAEASRIPGDGVGLAAAPRRTARQAALLRVLPAQERGPKRPFESGHTEVDAGFIAVWKRLSARALSGRSRIDWGYGEPQGDHRLRAAIAEYLAAARGVRCRPEQIVLTAGTQQGLSLVSRILLNPGDTAWVEDPCYRAAYDILRAGEARVVPVPVDDGGLDIAAPPPGQRPPQLLYTTPTRQYPLGVAMPLDRRRALLDWAEREGVWIVEDDYESEFQRPGHALPALQGLDRAARVIYLGTFSKLLFPSLRLGYAVLPEDLVIPFTAARHLSDRQSSGVTQAIMTDFILEGHFARHLKRMRAHYREHQEFLIDLLARRLVGSLDLRPVEPGMYLTVGLPPRYDDRAIAARLAAAGVTAMPLSALVLHTPRPPGLVLGYAGHGRPAMAQAVERMAEVLGRKLV